MIRHYFLAVIILLTGFVSNAQFTPQSKYFVYLQTEPAQPFYIKINGQQLSANASGYLILPQLKDGDYKLVVGFPQEKFPQQTYNFTIDSKDKGYLIKDFGSDGWGLFDLQTMAVQKPLTGAEAKAVNNNPQPVQQETAAPREDVSDFTKVLSKAANDPGLLEKPKEESKPVVEEKKEVVVEQPETKPVPEEVTSAPQPSQKPVEQPAENIVQESPPSAVQPAVSANNNISAGQTGVMLVYDNKNDAGEAEPVTIFISEPKNKIASQAQSAPQPAVSAAPAEQIPQATEEKRTVDNEPKNFEVEEKPAIAQEREDVTSKEVAKTNSSCKKFAGEDDFLKLRRQMSQKDTDEAMIGQAKAAFKSKCYTTAQIKYLSSMFLSNAGKYNFYEAARPHVADSENFTNLRSEIKDDYYLGKFDALVGQ